MKKLVLSGLFGIALLATSCGPSICDCVNIGEDADESMVEKCETMKEDWEKKFKDASDEEKEEMREEVKACRKDKKDEE